MRKIWRGQNQWFRLCINEVQMRGRKMAVFGYARVSTDGQTLGGQVSDLKVAGVTDLFREKVSGAVTDRPQLRRMLSRLDKGDVVLVTRLDRLARSTRDLLNILGTITEKGAGFRSLGYLGRHHHAPWPAHRHGPWRIGRI